MDLLPPEYRHLNPVGQLGQLRVGEWRELAEEELKKLDCHQMTHE